MNVTTTKQTMCNYWATLGTYIGAATSNPGATTTPSNETSGGGYLRLATTWTAGSGGVNTGSAVSLSIAASVTITYIILASAATTGAANMIDNASVSATSFSQAGNLVVTPTLTVA